MDITFRRETPGWAIAAALVILLAPLATPAGAQSQRPGAAAGAPSALPASPAGRLAAIDSRPRQSEDGLVVILLDEIREPAHQRQPEVILGADPARRARFVRISAQGLVPPPTIQVLCGKPMQALRLSASSRESDRTAGTYDVSPELAAEILAREHCHVSLAGALVAIPREMTAAAWQHRVLGTAGDAATDQPAPLAARRGCATLPTAARIADDRLSPSARLTATKVVEMLGEFSAWANGPASKVKGEYLSRLGQVEAASEELSSAAPAPDASVIGAVRAALDCFREAARSWPDVSALWAIGEHNVRAAEHGLGIKSPAEKTAEARQRGHDEQLEAQAQRAAAQREANARDATRRPLANAGDPADAATRDRMPAGAKVALAGVPFNGTDYFHRWSKNGQNEFTPRGEEDLEAWKSMLTIIVYDRVRTGDDLAGIAGRVREAYGTRGRVAASHSKPRTADREAEYFIAAVLGDPKFLEAVFARFLLFERTGIVVIVSKRIYGRRAGDDMSAWLGENGPRLQEALMSWKAIPSLSALRALPQAR